MAKYKEIAVNVKLTPEVILGEMLKRATAIKAEKKAKTDTKETEVAKK